MDDYRISIWQSEGKKGRLTAPIRAVLSVWSGVQKLQIWSGTFVIIVMGIQSVYSKGLQKPNCFKIVDDDQI